MIDECAETPIQLAKKTIEITDKVLDLYSALDSKIPWMQLNEILHYVDTYFEDYSSESAALVGKMKTNIMNVFDEIFKASHIMSELCSLEVPILRTNILLAKGNSAAKGKTQVRLLQKVLSESVERMTRAQLALEKIPTDFNAAIETFEPLFKKFEFDSDIYSESYRAKALALMDKYRSPVLTEQIVAELVGRLTVLTKFYKNLKDLINQSLLDFTPIETELKTQIKNFEIVKVQADDLNDVVTPPNSELRDATVRAAQNLIDKCMEYNKKTAKMNE